MIVSNEEEECEASANPLMKKNNTAVKASQEQVECGKGQGSEVNIKAKRRA